MKKKKKLIDFFINFLGLDNVHQYICVPELLNIVFKIEEVGVKCVIISNEG